MYPIFVFNDIIVPIWKKPNLNPNQTENYRPITIITTFSKLLELMLIPQTDICDTQLGFREGRGTAFGTRLLSESIILNIKIQPCMFVAYAKTNLRQYLPYISFLQTYDKLPPNHWVLCYKWYRNLNTSIRWQGNYSVNFCVTKGTNIF